MSAANQATDAGTYPSFAGQIVVHAGGFLETPEDVSHLVVAIHQGRPVYLGDVATIKDGPSLPNTYVFFGTGPAAGEKRFAPETAQRPPYPAVTLTLAKRKGTNAISVADKVLERVEALKGDVIPDDIAVTVTRNYGETAKEKTNELLLHMLIAIVSVTILIWFTLGHRESGVVAVAIPVTLALTMAVFYLYGYTLNRITLFALIFSIGILVDDAIVVVENIVRHNRLPGNADRPRIQVAVEAVDEVGNPTILATLTVIAAILPMAFVGGLMGPYMRPIPVGASAAMVFSLIVAFIVTPWAAYRLLRKRAGTAHGDPHDAEDWTTRLYRSVMDHLLHNPRWRVVLPDRCGRSAAGGLRHGGRGLGQGQDAALRQQERVPGDHGPARAATLEDTAAAAFEMGDYLATVNEVVDYQIHVGTAGPFNFNGLVRHYYLRGSPNLADIQVNLAGKGHRKQQSHAIAKRRAARGCRPLPSATGPGSRWPRCRPAPRSFPPWWRKSTVRTTSASVNWPWRSGRFSSRRTAWWTWTGSWKKTRRATRSRWTRKKRPCTASAWPTSPRRCKTALSGDTAGLLHQPLEKEDVPIILQPPLALRAGLERLKAITLSTPTADAVALSELVTIRADDRWTAASTTRTSCRWST